MSDYLSETKLREALAECDNEPVHIIGRIQPIGWLFACDVEEGIISHASANCADLLEMPIDKVLGQPIRELLGLEIWHALRNISSYGETVRKRQFAGLWRADEVDYAINVTKNDGSFLLELEPEPGVPLISTEMLREQTFLIEQIQSAQDQQSLFELTTRLLQHVTGFDRVMIYRFDPEWNGEILAEARRNGIESFNGLRFPHWDIPAQARNIMAQTDLRLISDAYQEPVPIHAAAGEGPVDITLAQMRGASAAHLQYLRNMGTHACMTLSVVLDGTLWGMISFHHSKPRVSPPEIRQILANAVLPVFRLKLGLLHGQATFALAKQLDDLQAEIHSNLERRTDLSKMLDSMWDSIRDMLDIDGLAITSGAQVYNFGNVPSERIVSTLIADAQEAETSTIAIDNLAAHIPGTELLRGETAGALVVARSEQRALLLFRREIRRSIEWAGNPDKTITMVDGISSLQPRGSFAKYLETKLDHCKAWTVEDRSLAKQLWPLLSAAERQSFMNDLTRQQVLMIGELNHRVRNILALVRSVSQKARKEGGSLASYSQALEARINALAAAHEIGAGAALAAVSIRRIIALEAKPYEDTLNPRVSVRGPEYSIKAELAPIFALVIHEMTTNAVKYGAMSSGSGRVEIVTSECDGGLTLEWTESGGPTVKEPTEFGFGTTLIRQAVPYELGGSSDIEFRPNGVRVFMTIPGSALEDTIADEKLPKSTADIALAGVPSRLSNGLIMIVEDNFMIATGVEAELNRLGFPNTEIFGNVEDAAEFIATETPSFALLDVNLGRGRTSESLATDLVARGVPVVFVTGYGDRLELPEHLAKVPILTKPATQAQILDCISRFSI